MDDCEALEKPWPKRLVGSNPTPSTSERAAEWLATSLENWGGRKTRGSIPPRSSSHFGQPIERFALNAPKTNKSH